MTNALQWFGYMDRGTFLWGVKLWNNAKKYMKYYFWQINKLIKYINKMGKLQIRMRIKDAIRLFAK